MSLLLIISLLHLKWMLYGSFKLSCYAAVETLAQLDDDSCDIDKIKSILLNKYKLKVIQDKPTIIEEIK